MSAGIRETSFGQMQTLLGAQNAPVIEHLRFERSGRGHRHASYETFVVLEGTGEIHAGDGRYSVGPGSVVTIPPNTEHWMVPTAGQVMEGFLWYHDQTLDVCPKPRQGTQE